MGVNRGFKSRKKKVVYGIVGALSALALAVLLALGYFGFVPGLSSSFGSDKPRDLGITYSERDLESAMKKLGLSIEEVPGGLRVRFGGLDHESVRLTQKELTALLNHELLAGSPLADVQVKIGDMGSVEMSGMLRPNGIRGLDLLPDSTPVYLKAAGEIVENVSEINIEKVEAGRMPLPGAVTDYIEQSISSAGGTADGVDVDALTFENGEVIFHGTIPPFDKTVDG